MEDVHLEFRSLIEEIAAHTNQVREKVKLLTQQIADDPPNVNKGLSILEVKYHAFLEYLIGITYGMLVKANGMSLQQNSLIDLIVENRTVIERIRPIEQKLKYQMDKVLKAARGDLSADDPLRYKANPDSLVAKEEASSDEESSEGDEDDRQKIDSKQSGGTYVPPKLVSMPYEGDLSLAEKKAQKDARIKRHLMTSTLLQELKEEYTDAPIELVDTDDIIKAKQHKKAKEKQEYEETYMTRMPVAKADRKGVKRSNLGTELTSFGNFASLMDEENEDLMVPSRKKTRSSLKKGKSGKGKKGKMFKRRK